MDQDDLPAADGVGLLHEHPGDEALGQQRGRLFVADVAGDADEILRVHERHADDAGAQVRDPVSRGEADDIRADRVDRSRDSAAAQRDRRGDEANLGSRRGGR